MAAEPHLRASQQAARCEHFPADQHAAQHAAPVHQQAWQRRTGRAHDPPARRGTAAVPPPCRGPLAPHESAPAACAPRHPLPAWWEAAAASAGQGASSAAASRQGDAGRGSSTRSCWQKQQQRQLAAAAGYSRSRTSEPGQGGVHCVHTVSLSNKHTTQTAAHSALPPHHMGKVVGVHLACNLQLAQPPLLGGPTACRRQN